MSKFENITFQIDYINRCKQLQLHSHGTSRTPRSPWFSPKSSKLLQTRIHHRLRSQMSKHDQDNSHFVSNKPEDDLFNVSFTVKPIRDSIRRCCKGYFCDFRAGNLPRSEVQVGQHQFLRGVVALPFNGWWERAGSVGKPKSRQWRCWPEGDLGIWVSSNPWIKPCHFGQRQ